MKQWLICLLGLFALSVQAVDRPAFSRIVMFGDSLSDTGKMYQKMKGYLPSSPPYYNGRFSNGPVWLEHLRDDYFPGLLLANEAEGGATAVAYNKLGWGNIWAWDPKYQVINNLDYEISQFLNKDKFRPDDVVVIWVGANDYLAYGWTKNRDVDRVITTIRLAANRLVLNGAKHIVLLNLPDLSRTPSAVSMKIVESMRQVSRYHNQRLLNLTRELAPLNIVKLFAVDQQFDEMMQNPQQFGLSDTQHACYDGSYWWTPFSRTTAATATHLPLTLPEQRAIAGNPLLAQTVVKPQATRRAIAPNCNEHMFWDQVHPTVTVHKALGQRVAQFMEQYYEFLPRRS
ncbi:SGNH/GDSL hydrolase family protein [Aeromonas cavernicola]|uniref:Phosphatidylcholine-sterol acyltransferase n=1 Tax=Aeromonas cavernicola TaxID=1006623 RepID=A0A2H9U2W4_9GAMM|nr:SGNH/GDSL hydrolase family protein [Aeromonas cavernicola]PJG58361.1 phosphatidylcholine-sterol acyltransferase [Aeromonas cavernicola]